MKYLSILFVLLTTLLLSSCMPSANPNEWIITTTTCWNTISVLKAGSPIPHLYTTCDCMIALPSSELGMELECETKFAGRAAGIVSVSGNWRISDPEIFIQNAKSLVSSTTSEGHKVNPDALEEVENRVVDKMWKDVIRELTPKMQVINLSEKEIEDSLLVLANTKLTGRGVSFSGMSVNVDFSPQTEEALDAASALQIYNDLEQEELGKEIIKAKAGATTITIINNTTTTPSEE